MLKRFWAVVVLLTFAFTLITPAAAQDEVNPGVTQAVDFLTTMQNPDGGFTNGFAPESDAGATADAIIAIVAAGQNPNTFFTGDMFNPFTFLGIQAEADQFTSAGLLAKLMIAVIASGKDQTAFGGHNLVDDLLALQDADSGVFGTGPFDHCLSLIALQNAGVVELPAGALDALLAAQNENGGWAFMAEQAPDVDTTALCVQALAPLGEQEAIDQAVAYLQPIQNEDGGWPYQNPSDFGTESSTSSTALVVQALLALGEDLAAWNNPQDWLASMQADSGSFNLSASMPGDNFLATAAGIPALQGVPLTAWIPEPAAE